MCFAKMYLPTNDDVMYHLAQLLELFHPITDKGQVGKDRNFSDKWAVKPLYIAFQRVGVSA